MHPSIDTASLELTYLFSFICNNLCTTGFESYTVILPPSPCNTICKHN